MDGWEGGGGLVDAQMDVWMDAWMDTNFSSSLSEQLISCPKFPIRLLTRVSFELPAFMGSEFNIELTLKIKNYSIFEIWYGIF